MVLFIPVAFITSTFLYTEIGVITTVEIIPNPSLLSGAREAVTNILHYFLVALVKISIQIYSAEPSPAPSSFCSMLLFFLTSSIFFSWNRWTKWKYLIPIQGRSSSPRTIFQTNKCFHKVFDSQRHASLETNAFLWEFLSLWRHFEKCCLPSQIGKKICQFYSLNRKDVSMSLTQQNSKNTCNCQLYFLSWTLRKSFNYMHLAYQCEKLSAVCQSFTKHNRDTSICRIHSALQPENPSDVRGVFFN